MTDAGRCLPESFPLTDERTFQWANELEDRAATVAGAEVWNFNDRICRAGVCEAQRDGILVWRDKDHISVTMSESLAPDVAARLTAPAS